MTLSDQFDRLGLEEINRFVDEGKGEDLHLEFKTVQKSDLSRQEDRQMLATCMSGFANSDGGIVIWGVQTKKDDEGVDRAIAPAPMIEPLQLFYSRLNEITGDVLNTVQHKSVPTGGDIGFAVTVVPASDSAPHRAEFGLKKYFKRSGSSFREMEHFELEDMFGRRQRPDLHLTITPMFDLRDEREQFGFVFRNTGRALAKHVGFLARVGNARIANVSGGTMQDATPLNKGCPTVVFADNHGVIHPIGLETNVGWAAFTRLEKDKPIVVSVTWYCENMASRETTFEIPPTSGGQS